MRSSRLLLAGVVTTLVVVTAAVYTATAAPLATAIVAGDPVKTGALKQITWDFGFVEGHELTVYGTPLPPCTHLTEPVALAVSDGHSYTVALTGRMDTTSGCPTPMFSQDGLSISDKNGLSQATVKLGDDASPSQIKDALGGIRRPVYARSELPVGFPGSGAHYFSRGAHSSDDEPAEFGGEFDWTGYPKGSDRYTHLELKFRGLGLSPADPQMGDVVIVGGRQGWIAPQANGKSYRFVWFAPRGESWIGYELYPTRNKTTKDEFIATLQKLTWS